MKLPRNPLQLPKPTRNTRKIENILMTIASGEINLQKHNLTCHIAKVKAATSVHSMANVIPFLVNSIFRLNPTLRKNPKKIYFIQNTETISVIFQQLLANKHPRLRDSVPIVIWPRGGLGLVTDQKTKKIINPVQSKNRARPMAARLKNYHHVTPLFYMWQNNKSWSFQRRVACN